MFPLHFSKGNNFCDFLFASLDTKALKNWGLLLQKRGPFDEINLIV